MKKLKKKVAFIVTMCVMMMYQVMAVYASNIDGMLDHIDKNRGDKSIFAKAGNWVLDLTADFWGFIIIIGVAGIFFCLGKIILSRFSTNANTRQSATSDNAKNIFVIALIIAFGVTFVGAVFHEANRMKGTDKSESGIETPIEGVD